MRSISPATHAAIVARAHLKNGRSTMFAKFGEDQGAACKRLVTGAKRSWKALDKRDYPVFKDGMSTAEYVRLYESINGGKHLKREDFFAPLNAAPATLYEGGLIDYAPEVAECEADTFDYLGTYSEHVAASNLIGKRPMSSSAWIKRNSPEMAQPLAQPEPAEPDNVAQPVDVAPVESRPAQPASVGALLGGARFSTAILRHPTGTYGIVGSVPVALSVAYGGAFPGRKSLTWATEGEAVAALLGIGLTRFQMADCSWYVAPVAAAPDALERSPDPAPVSVAPDALADGVRLRRSVNEAGFNAASMALRRSVAQVVRETRRGPVARDVAPDVDEVARIVGVMAGKPDAAADLRARADNMRAGVRQGMQWPGAVQDAAADLTMARARVYDAAADAIDAQPGPDVAPVAPVAPVAHAAPPVAVCAAPVAETPVHPLAASAAKLASLRQELAETSPDLPQTIGFLRHVIGTHQGLHDKLAAAFAVFDSVGIGAELANSDGRRFCVILPDASAPGAYRWQGFDKSGFFTHSTHKTAALAVADAAGQGYTVAAPGSLDRLAGAPEWARGMAISEVMQAHNAGLMPWAAACDRMRDIHAEHDALAAAAPAGPDLEPAPHVAEPAPPVTVSTDPDVAMMRKAADRAQVLADGIKAAAGDDPATMARMLKSESARIKAATLRVPARIAASYRATADMLEYAAELHADALDEVPDMALKPQPGMRGQATARRPVMARRGPLEQPWRMVPSVARRIGRQARRGPAQGMAAPRMRPQAAAPPVRVCAAPVGESGQRFN